jgi:mannose-1-phosphate guanylyltransferase
MGGRGTVIIDGKKRDVSAGDTVSMPAGTKHTVTAEDELRIIEAQLGREINVEDKIKYPFPGE